MRPWNFFYMLLLSVATVLPATLLAAASPKAKPVAPATHVRPQELMSRSRYSLNMNCQVIRSRAQSSLAGTVTENYQMTWTVLVRDQRILIESMYGSVDAHWEPESANFSLGRITLTRAELVKLVGLEQELPQDALLWHADAPVMLPVMERSNRSLEQVLRHADDNGMLIVRLAVRV